ncbi:MAG: AraC family transcriptional regulator, partial [Lachnospiraceae bacterium]|nr:AraC family transcriptional regulator [Lachnospiraceae bacterium]
YVIQNETIIMRRQNFTNNLRTFLLEHLSENLDADNIASCLGVSRSKLYMACNKYLGMGIAEYVRDLRLEEAKNLLKTTDLSITDIAMRVGFDDYNYFSRVFKKETGYSAKNHLPHIPAGDSIYYYHRILSVLSTRSIKPPDIVLKTNSTCT